MLPEEAKKSRGKKQLGATASDNALPNFQEKISSFFSLFLLLALLSEAIILRLATPEIHTTKP